MIWTNHSRLCQILSVIGLLALLTITLQYSLIAKISSFRGDLFQAGADASIEESPRNVFCDGHPEDDVRILVVVADYDLLSQEEGRNLLDGLSLASHEECFRLRLCVNQASVSFAESNLMLSNELECFQEHEMEERIQSVIILNASSVRDVSRFFHVWADAVLRKTGFDGVALMGQRLRNIPFSLPGAVISTSEIGSPAALSIRRLTWADYSSSRENRATIQSLLRFLMKKQNSKLVVPNFPTARTLVKIRDGSSGSLLTLEDDPKELLSRLTFDDQNGEDLDELFFLSLKIAIDWFHSRSGPRPLVLSVLSQHFLPMARNFVCNVKGFEGVLDDYVFLCVDEQCVSEMRRFRRVVQADYLVIGLPIHPEEISTKQELRSDTVGYRRLTFLRQKVILGLLSSGLSVLHAETDITWFEDSVRFMRFWARTPIVVSRNKPGRKCGGTNEKAIPWLNTGLMLFRIAPTTIFYTKHLIAKLSIQFDQVKNMSSEESSQGLQLSDQDEFQNLFCKYDKKTNGGVSFVDWTKGPSGLILNELDEGYFREGRHKNMSFLHQNGEHGVNGKIARAKKFGLWFLNEDGSCNHERVESAITKKVFQEYP